MATDPSTQRIRFPVWYANGPRDPYGTHKQIEQALHDGHRMPTLQDPNVLIDVGDRLTGMLLIKAVEKKRTDVVQLLISRGADLKDEHVSLLHAAVWAGRYTDAVFVLDMGAAVDAGLARAHSRPPLMRAADRARPCRASQYVPERLAMIKLLLSRGANIDARDKYGHKAQLIAERGTPAYALLADVRSAGGWRAYARRCNHIDRLRMLNLRVLCERGRAKTEDALLSRLFPSVETAEASDDEAAAEVPARLDAVDRDAFRHVFSFWPPPSRVLAPPTEEHPVGTLHDAAGKNLYSR